MPSTIMLALLGLALAEEPVPTPTPAPPAAGSLATLDAKAGFRDLTWGQAPTADMTVLKEFPGERMVRYERKSDKLSVGDVPLVWITYEFRDGQLLLTSIAAAGEDAGSALHNTLNRVYGPGEKNPDRYATWVWPGQVTRLVCTYEEWGIQCSFFDAVAGRAVSEEFRSAEAAKVQAEIDRLAEEERRRTEAAAGDL